VRRPKRPHVAGSAFSAGFDMKASAERDMSTVEHVRRQMERQFEDAVRRA
jgi:enoyl-CoA hydratase/carnithine racemase